MKKAIFLVLLLGGSAAAQSTGDFSEFAAWVSSQQAHVGMAWDMSGTKYATTWWDAVSVGQSGMNVGKAGALDYLDFGPTFSAANREAPRYGAAVPVHLGNIWNTLADHLPTAVKTHVKIVTLPNVTAAAMFLMPQNLPINRWNWCADFRAAIAYRFGGS